jgi:hypothetical protein
MTSQMIPNSLRGAGRHAYLDSRPSGPGACPSLARLLVTVEGDFYTAQEIPGPYLCSGSRLELIGAPEDEAQDSDRDAWGDLVHAAAATSFRFLDE